MSDDDECDCCGQRAPSHQIVDTAAFGIETSACMACRGFSTSEIEDDRLGERGAVVELSASGDYYILTIERPGAETVRVIGLCGRIEAVRVADAMMGVMR